MATGTIAADSSSAEAEALKLAFSYLVNTMDTSSLLPAALSRGLIREQQRTECTSEANLYKKTEKFLEHLQREVNGDNKKFHIFVQLLKDTGHANLALRLRDELSNATRLIQAIATTNIEGEHHEEQIVVPDLLLEELATLRVNYARLLRRYKREILISPEAQEEFVETLPGLLHRGLGSERNFQSYFDTLVEEEVSLFNITYLKQICDIFPENICATTKELVEKYEKQRQHFMTSTTVNQFKKLFPASAIPTTLSTGKISLLLKLHNKWGHSTLSDLTDLVNLFGIPGNYLHLSKADKGCIAVVWLSSITVVKELKGAIYAVADLLQTKGILQVFLQEELVLDCSQSGQEFCSHEARMFAFVNEPDSDYFCPVCQDLLTEPFQPDCGHHLCRSCHDRLLKMKKVECPTCREVNALNNARLDKYLERKVNNLKVRCMYHREGCKWVGEVRYLHDHLDNCATACPLGCDSCVHRKKLKDHKSLHCPNRLISCKNCDYYNTFTIVTKKHYPICPWSPVDCPNNCQVRSLKQSELQQHLSVCSDQLVDCPSTGCYIRLPRREMKLHSLQQHNLVLEETNQTVAITLPAKASSQYLYNQVPLEFVIPNITSLIEANAVWSSPSFFTHENGYKFYIEVYPNAYPKVEKSHLEVYVRLVKSDNDRDLVWPFEGSFVFEVINWKAEKQNVLATIDFNRYTDPDGSCTSRVCEDDYHANRALMTRFNLDFEIDTDYLNDDCLHLKVVDVAVYSTPLLSKTPLWQTTTQSVCVFTLTEFSKRKQLNNKCYSPPFYSHPHGYKLCLIVYANGGDDYKGTHISIFAFLMRGDYDNNLKWPFEGNVTIELLNWNENSHHYRGGIISFDIISDFNDCVSRTRVTDRRYSCGACGVLDFIPHSSLLCNPDTNTEYLQDDCLHLRVVDVAVYSTPLLSKTPSWQDPHTATQSVCEFTLTEFTKRKQLNIDFYCPPFYTNGYRMVIQVRVIGEQNTETHVSVYVFLMKGVHDGDLDWPFKGEVTVELINWRENQGHLSSTILFNQHTDSNCASRVVERDISQYGWGNCDEVFFHSSLPFNPVTNTEYLQDDCLRFRVREVRLHK